jgi:hypothetical protein
VTIDGVWIGNRIYWTLKYSAWLQVSIMICLTVIHTSRTAMGFTWSSQSLTFFTTRCMVAASNFGLSPSSMFPYCPHPQLPASNSNSSQQRNASGYLTNCNCQSSVKLLLVIASSVVLDFESHWDPWPYSSFQDFYVFSNGASLRRKEESDHYGSLPSAGGVKVKVKVTFLRCPACNISARTAQKASFLCCSKIVAFISVGVPKWSLLSHCPATAVFSRAIT